RCPIGCARLASPSGWRTVRHGIDHAAARRDSEGWERSRESGEAAQMLGMRRWMVAGLLMWACSCVLTSAASRTGDEAVTIPAPALANPKAAGPRQTAVIAGGCFWGVQGVYQHVRGVQRVLSGYSGGTKATAMYDVVSSGATDHAESVEIRFDPEELSYGEILQIYFSVAHDPTQLNRQGPDTGREYRSNIFYADESQRRIAEAYIAQLEKVKVFRATIATRVDAL